MTEINVMEGATRSSNSVMKIEVAAEVASDVAHDMASDVANDMAYDVASEMAHFLLT